MKQTEYQRVGSRLNTLRSNRHRADYALGLKLGAHDSRSQLKQAKSALKDLEALIERVEGGA